MRDQAILELFYSSGLRLSELTGLNLDQLDLADGLVEVLGKGSKTRVLPVGKKAREALQAWLPLRSLANPQDDAVFVSQRGTRLGPRAIQLRVKAAGERELGQNLQAVCQGDRRRITGSATRVILHPDVRSEERRVGKECRSRWSPYH